MPLYPTPHINASPDDFARTVLMPGDPMRAKFIAENFLQSPKLINNVRGVQGYTGCYDGARVSVMASGMGIPSIGIYSYELYNIFGVENIIRIGSAGALREDIRLRDIVIAMGASTNSRFFAPVRACGKLRADLQLRYAQGVRGCGFRAENTLSCRQHSLVGHLLLGRVGSSRRHESKRRLAQNGDNGD